MKLFEIEYHGNLRGGTSGCSSNSHEEPNCNITLKAKDVEDAIAILREISKTDIIRITSVKNTTQ